MAFTYVTLTRTYETADDLPASGTVTFTPVDQMVNGITIEAAPAVATLDTAGSIAKRLAATTDPATTPPGVTYQVVERLAGQPTRTYYVSVPHDQGSTLDLTTLTVITGSGGAAGFALRAATDYDDSVAPTDGQVMTWDSGTSKFHPEASAGGAVTSVNGSTGAVTVTPTGIGAQPIDSDLTAFAALAPADGSLLSRQAGAWAGRTTSQVKADLALDQVNNTSDASKPVSTATQTALDAKAPLASPTFTGTVAGPRFVGAVQTVTYATSITLDASLYTTFRVVATGNITTTTITNPTAGQTLYLLVQASGANRDVTVAGSTITVLSGTWKLFQLAYDAPTTTWVLETATTTGGGGVPDDGSVTNAKVAVAAGIDLDKTADSATRLAMTAAERTKLAGIATGATVYTSENARDDLGAALVAGANVTITPNDAGDIITIAAAGGSGSSTVLKTIVSGTTYTPVLTDAGKVIDTTNSSPVSVLIPTNASVAFPTDTVLEVCQYGAGQITFGSTGGTSFSEPFTTSLALTWSTVAGGAISVSGGTQGVLSGSSAQVRAEHDVGSSDMFSQLTWVSGGTSADSTLGVLTRHSSSANTAYLLEVDDFTNFWTFSKVVAGTYTQLGTGSVSPTKPTTVRLESQGTSHRCYVGGSLVTTVTDASITTGQRGGIISYQPASTSIVFDDFSTGALTGGVTIRTPAGLTTRARYSTVALRYRGSDEWLLSGDLS